MAAHEYLQGEQLSMFIPARELMNYTAGHPENYGDEYLLLSKSPGVLKQKLKESKEVPAHGMYTGLLQPGQETMYQSIAKKGVVTSVSLKIRKNDVQIDDGHHRIASAYDIDPNMEIPVRYS